MAVTHPGEQVVFDLVVEAAVELAKEPTTNIGRAHNLNLMIDIKTH